MNKIRTSSKSTGWVLTLLVFVMFCLPPASASTIAKIQMATHESCALLVENASGTPEERGLLKSAWQSYNFANTVQSTAINTKGVLIGLALANPLGIIISGGMAINGALKVRDYLYPDEAARRKSAKLAAKAWNKAKEPYHGDSFIKAFSELATSLQPLRPNQSALKAALIYYHNAFETAPQDYELMLNAIFSRWTNFTYENTTTRSQLVAHWNNQQENWRREYIVDNLRMSIDRGGLVDWVDQTDPKRRVTDDNEVFNNVCAYYGIRSRENVERMITFTQLWKAMSYEERDFFVLYLLPKLLTKNASKVN